jgi:cytochrome c-type biogenesis protein
MDGFDVSHIGAFLGGLLSFLSPCVLPLVLPYLCFLSGVTFEEFSAANDGADNKAVGRRVVYSALSFVLGFTVVFVSFGATATLISGFVAENMTVLSRIAGVVIALFGLHMMGAFQIAALSREFRFHMEKRPPGFIGAFVIGLAFAFGWAPCVGPVLAVVLAAASAKETAIEGAGLLGIYSLGMGLPFLIAAFAINPFLDVFKRLRPYLGRFEMITGALLVLTGVAIFFGVFVELGFWMQRHFPSLGRLG